MNPFFPFNDWPEYQIYDLITYWSPQETLNKVLIMNVISTNQTCLTDWVSFKEHIQFNFLLTLKTSNHEHKIESELDKSLKKFIY